MNNECGCRVEHTEPGGDAHVIVYCLTHEAAFRLADALAETQPFLGVEFPAAEDEIKALEAKIAVLLGEVGAVTALRS